MDVEGDRDMEVGATADAKAGEELQQGLKVQYDAASHPLSLSSSTAYVLYHSFRDRNRVPRLRVRMHRPLLRPTLPR
jgi:hypothetical protein